VRQQSTTHSPPPSRLMSLRSLRRAAHQEFSLSSEPQIGDRLRRLAEHMSHLPHEPVAYHDELMVIHDELVEITDEVRRKIEEAEST
jgi:hypothetical protein